MEVIVKEQARQDLEELDEEIKDRIISQIGKTERERNTGKSNFYRNRQHGALPT